MPHSTITLLPGIDTSETPALNEAAFVSSQLIRFKPDRNGKGLVEKLGGWLQYSTATFTGVSELRAWQDLSNIKRLAVGDTTGLYYLQYGQLNFKSNITPQATFADVPYNIANPITSFVANPTNTITTTFPVSSGLAIVFSNSGGALPAGIAAGTLYFTTNSSYSGGSWTFQISVNSSGTPVTTFSTTGTGTSTFKLPIATSTNGSGVVTIYDTSLGFANATFASNVVSVTTDATNLNLAAAPITGNPVKFYGTSLPAGVTAGTTYYAIRVTSTTYTLSSSYPTIIPVGFTGGSGQQFIPNQMQLGYDVNFMTPVSVANLLLSGDFQVASVLANTLYNVYNIQSSILATSSTTGILTSFQLTNLTSLITVFMNNQPYINGATATILWPTATNGVTIYGNYIASATSANQFNITASSAATATVTVFMNTLTNGNAYVHIGYTFNVPSAFSSGGYGSGGYGSGGYGIGSISSTTINATPIGSSDWTIANFGETLVANPQGGGIYYWSPTANTTNAYLLDTAPLVNYGILVAMPARQLVAYGSTVTGILDPLLVRWSDAGDFTTWAPSPLNQAGSYRIPEGSQIVAAIQAAQQTLIWTDVALWSMQYVGPQAVYGFNKIADGAGAISKKCVGVINGAAYWMAPRKFMELSTDGPVPLLCPVWDRVFQNLNLAAAASIRCAVNSVFNEISWYYPSANSSSNDSYVKYNVLTETWDFGSLDRTAWIDQSVLGTPIGASSAGILYQHEIGFDDNTNPMVSTFLTGYMQLNEADNLIFIDQVWPDFKWQTTSGSTTPAIVYMTFYGLNFPGDTPTVYGPYAMIQGTEYVNVRIRNRLLAIGFSTSSTAFNTGALLNTFYRIGALRYRYQLDGKF